MVLVLGGALLLGDKAESACIFLVVMGTKGCMLICGDKVVCDACLDDDAILPSSPLPLSIISSSSDSTSRTKLEWLPGLAILRVSKNPPWWLTLPCWFLLADMVSFPLPMERNGTDWSGFDWNGLDSIKKCCF